MWLEGVIVVIAPLANHQESFYSILVGIFFPMDLRKKLLLNLNNVITNKIFIICPIGLLRSKKYAKPIKGAVKQSVFFGLASWGRNRKMQKNQNIYTNGRNATAY